MRPVRHSLRMTLPARTLLFAFMAGFMSLAQPGICPCWLLNDVHDIHPHPAGHPEIPHSHDYLFAMFASAPALPPSLPLEPPSVLLDLASLRGVWRNHAEADLGQASTGPPPPTPPPETVTA
jgi:hypothetical protein